MLSIKSHFSVQVVQCDLLLKVMWMVVMIINLHAPLENVFRLFLLDSKPLEERVQFLICFIIPAPSLSGKCFSG